MSVGRLTCVAVSDDSSREAFFCSIITSIYELAGLVDWDSNKVFTPEIKMAPVMRTAPIILRPSGIS